MRELSLFTGAGGGVLGTHGLLGWKCRGYVEWTAYCQRVIRQRIDDGILDDAPIFGDIRTFVSDGYARRYRGMVDVVSGGFPCQPFSVAGKQKAGDDERDMWPATIAVVREVRPRFVFLENVPGLLAGSHGYFGNVLRDLAEAGYDARWCVLGASDVGAPHRRKRLWIVGHSNEFRLSGPRVQPEQSGRAETLGTGEVRQESAMAYRDNKHGVESDEEVRSGRDSINDGGGTVGDGAIEGGGGLSVRSGRQVEEAGDIDGSGPWSDAVCVEYAHGKYRAIKPGLRLLVDGYPGRVDEIKAIGNGQVPLVAATAWQILSEGIV